MKLSNLSTRVSSILDRLPSLIDLCIVAAVVSIIGPGSLPIVIVPVVLALVIGVAVIAIVRGSTLLVQCLIARSRAVARRT